MDKQRLFMAVSLPDDIKARIGEVIKQLSTSGADVKWVSPENLHITMKFFGDTDPSLVSDIKASCQAACSVIKPFRIDIGGIGSFSRRGIPSVVWVGITEGAAQLALIASRIDEVAAIFGFEKEKRPFSAHITLGRLRSDGKACKLQEVIDACKEKQIGSIDVSAVALMRSDLRPSGPIYTRIDTIYLSN
jgi:2'-5' RNA ligase